MTNIKFVLAYCFILITATTFAAKTYQGNNTGFPGDNFNLEGALDLFRSSYSLQEFENKLNSPDYYVNNLDLNQDGLIDYIRVDDYYEGNVHAIVLQTLVNDRESQDIAVIEIENRGDQTAFIQIVGNEYLYGEQIIIEPHIAYSQPNTRVVVNIVQWPAISFLYAPRYVVYRSNWRWQHYPGYWKPWRPFSYRDYYYHPRTYAVNYNVVNVRRVVYAPRIYQPYRSTSVAVENRYHVTRDTRRTSRPERTDESRATNGNEKNRSEKVKTQGNSRENGGQTRGSGNARKENAGQTRGSGSTGKENAGQTRGSGKGNRR